jgi:hypothetical protein
MGGAWQGIFMGGADKQSQNECNQNVILLASRCREISLGGQE